jgi:glycerophosphoryl diester phosphodiesterase
MSRIASTLAACVAIALAGCAAEQPREAPRAAGSPIQVGPRPYYLVQEMAEGPLKDELLACADGPFRRTRFSIGHRGAPLQFPEHTRASYTAAARMGAGILECDAAFTRDRRLVCRHAQCDLHTTTNILAIPELAAKCTQPFVPADPLSGAPASARCCTSDITLAEYRTLCGKMDASDPEATRVEAYMGGTLPWRTDLYASCGEVLSVDESIALFDALGTDFSTELKAPEVEMPFQGDYTIEAYAQQLIDRYEALGIAPERVWLQSFDLEVIRYWLREAPEFARQAVFLDGRSEEPGFDSTDPQSWTPSMQALHAEGLRVIAPPLWLLVVLDEAGRITPSAYARAARAAGLEIIPWTLERSGPLTQGGGWYYQSVTAAITGDGHVYELLDVLSREVGIRGIFSDWPATSTYYASCKGLD